MYELRLGNGRSASPFVWRIRYALAHTGLPFESELLGFREIPVRFAGRFKTVPVIERGLDFYDGFGRDPRMRPLYQ